MTLLRSGDSAAREASDDSTEDGTGKGHPRRPRFPLALDRLKGPARPAASDLLRPQRPLQHAADHALRQQASRPGAASGFGLDSAAVRARMVRRLRAQGIDCEPVLQAFDSVERHRFVDTALATQAYEDTSLPIGLSQTISKPSVVARMLSLLFDGGHARAHGRLGRVLEIGTGCGYQAALLALLSRSVVSIERLQPLHDKARRNLDSVRTGDLRLLWGDGRLGHTPRAPYDAIIAAAGGHDLPQAWLDQLAPEGRLVAPMHDATRGGQVLVVVDRTTRGLVRRQLDAVHFVPLKSGAE
ncbi:MAG: protein-L-isoaspartate(D-aspartate) O-methyltransferase [Rubrivivax sp.]